MPLPMSSHQSVLVVWRLLALYQCPTYLLLVLSQSFRLDNLPSKTKESYLPLATALLALAKGATPDSGGRECPHSRSRLKLCLSNSSATCRPGAGLGCQRLFETHAFLGDFVG